MDLWGEAAMDAEELLVHQGGERETIESFHAGIVHSLGILDLACKLSIFKPPFLYKKLTKRITFLFKCKIFRQMSALVIASQQVKGSRMTDLQRPQVQDTLLNNTKISYLYNHLKFKLI